MCVTRSRTTSFLTSGVSFSSSIANLINFLGMLKSKGNSDECPAAESLGPLLVTEIVEVREGAGEHGNREGDVATVASCEDD